jgi:hypothetical protein
VQHVDVGGHGERQPHRRGPHPPQVLRGDDLGQVGLTVAGDPGLGVGHAVGRLARRLECGLGTELPDEVAVARPARARREPLLRAVPWSEEVTLDQALQLTADLVGGGGSELLRHVEQVHAVAEDALLAVRVREEAGTGHALFLLLVA